MNHLAREIVELREIVRKQSERIAELDAEVLEQARCNGMGAERELALMAEVERLMAWQQAAFSAHVADKRPVPGSA